MTTQEFIIANADADVAALALKGAPAGVDLPYALRQIEGRQTARRKLPLWAATEGIEYPVRLSMQQCSSQTAAEYKASVVKSGVGERRLLVDLTGGLGVDFSFLAPLFQKAVYVERNAELCATARHNLPLLGLPEAEVICAESHDATGASLIFLDPARRDGSGRKLVRMEDCQPNVAEMQDELLRQSPVVMVKLSPMLDVSQALRQLRCVSDVHFVEAEGECKELLFVLRRGHEGEPVLHCQGFTFTRSQELAEPVACADGVGEWLYEPSAAMMKAAPFRLLARRYGLQMLHPDSHLYTSAVRIDGFPGRTMHVDDVCDVRTLRRLHPEVTQANITVHAYPDTPDSLRRRLKLKDGGQHYLFATALSSGRKALLLCHR